MLLKRVVLVDNLAVLTVSMAIEESWVPTIATAESLKSRGYGRINAKR